MLLQPLKARLPDPNILPDPLDPNLYCRVCKKISKLLGVYRAHCRDVQHMTLGPISLRFPFPDSIVDLNNSDFYCAKCDKNLTKKESLKRHLVKVHRITQFS